MSSVSPVLIDLIIAGVFLELILLSLLLRKFQAVFLIAPLFFFLISGALLLAAMRLAISGSSFVAIGAALFAALISHVLLLSWCARRFLSQDAGDV